MSSTEMLEEYGFQRTIPSGHCDLRRWGTRLEEIWGASGCNFIIRHMAFKGRSGKIQEIKHTPIEDR